MQTVRYAHCKYHSSFILRCRTFIATIEVPQKKNGEMSRSCAPICSKTVGAGAGLGGGPAESRCQCMSSFAHALWSLSQAAELECLVASILTEKLTVCPHYTCQLYPARQCLPA